MSRARVTSVHSQSLAYHAGIVPGDVIVAINGEPLRDVIRYHELVNAPTITMTIERSGIETDRTIARENDAELGIELDAPTFDRIRTCDNHCPFCFIYQLPKGMRETLYVKDDDYRLSFLYGNFTTMTRFNELDLERVIDEGLSPLYVSVHATDPEVRSVLLRNKRGAISLRWLGPLLENGIDVHMQIVVCPGINDGDVLRATLEDIADQYPTVSSIAVVPLGVSDHSNEESMIPHTQDQAKADVAIVKEFQRLFLALKNSRTVYVSDEYYIIAGLEIPTLQDYDDLSQTENGVGMVAEFRDVFEKTVSGRQSQQAPRKTGFFQWVEAAPAFGYRQEKLPAESTQVSSTITSRPRNPVVIMTGEYALPILSPMVEELKNILNVDIKVKGVKNEFFGGNIKVAGLVTGQDLIREISKLDKNSHIVIPDVMLTKGLFIDGVSIDSIDRAVSVIETTASALYEFMLDYADGKIMKQKKKLLPLAEQNDQFLNGCGSGELS